MKIKGIDVSSHNGTIDFESVKNSGVEVVIIKATEGVDFVDDLLSQHYNGANGVIPHIGFYHFMSEKTDPSQQAEDFYNAIKGKNYDVKPCLDIEVNNYGRSASEITDRCLAFINRFRELSGQEVIIYTGGYFGRDNLDSRVKCYGGWIAHYGVDSPMETGFPLVGHQYTESGSLSGIDGNVDINNFYEGIFLGSSYSGDISGNNNSEESLVDKAREFVGSRCSELQQLLINKGYDCGGCGADGKFGQGTYNSLIQFQKDNGLVADGLAGEQTFNALYNNSNGDDWVRRLQQECNSQRFSNQIVDGIAGENTLNGCPTIRQGASGNITRLLQEKLNNLGYDTNGADGIFGTGTYNAVLNFQRDHQLGADGIVGENTWRELLEM
ncbi:GH25 family lysozyme [Clostridium sp. HBUAS56017]|uniref:GH25 family lysozyme n=1 Tax=Clostridium sp. HBUAS56017 TaxID=2571128 RepID=UPI001FA9E04D|nr:GH25 family lysozyme [Clostridium sp. HBUAS56017]